MSDVRVLSFGYVQVGDIAVEWGAYEAVIVVKLCVLNGFFCSAQSLIRIVEDTESVRTLIATELGFYGYRVLPAPNGEEALAIAEREEGAIDLLLTDVVMPKMNGRELAERLAARYPGLKVLFNSGYPADTLLRHGIAEASAAFIEKPFVPDDLARKIREVLDTPGSGDG